MKGMIYKVPIKHKEETPTQALAKDIQNNFECLFCLWRKSLKFDFARERCHLIVFSTLLDNQMLLHIR